MLTKIIKGLFGEKKERDIKRLSSVIESINMYAEEYKSLSHIQFPMKTEEFKKRLAEGETLDDLLPEVYGLVKEACRRHLKQQWVVAGNEISWDMVPYDVQLAGAIVLHQGTIAEMATGEGKTLVAIMPVYLNALTGKSVHVITVNDYLAQRDAEWMGKIYESLGLTIGCIISDMEPATRREQYACDITYGTNNEFGFDYLRDNMTISREHIVQRGHHFAIVDEVDNILIDEARTPLIISGPVDHSTQQYDKMLPMVSSLVRDQNALVNRIIKEIDPLLENEESLYEAGIKLLQAEKGAPKNKRFTKIMQEPENQRLLRKVESEYLQDKKSRGDKMDELENNLFYVIDEKGHNIDLTEKGRNRLAPDNPEMFVLNDIVDEMAQIEARKDISDSKKDELKEEVRTEHELKSEELHNISQLLRAYSLFEKDVGYVVQDGKVVIVDEFTGRLMPGRRWSDGLHQAVEAKEGVKIERETQTLATITLQNYFRLYDKLAGMTGTALTEAQEFFHTYKMDVVEIPTHRPIRREDYDDVIYRTKREKYNALIDEIERLNNLGRPILVGTVSVEVSELISRMLKRKGISHNVLNAKNHAREAEIVRGAGEKEAVTIATNMAGRGTDIKLGPGVIECGGDCYDKINKKYDGELPSEWKETGYCKADTPCGLYVLGTERHEARRIDLQLRGRSARQGDPGASKFFLSLEDDLMRLFGSERMSGILSRIGMQEGDPIIHPLISRAIGNAQKKIEGINFGRRKHTLDYDDVMNKQRTAVYGLRQEVLFADELKDILLGICYKALRNEFSEFGDPEARATEEWNIPGYVEWVERCVPSMDFKSLKDQRFDNLDELLDTLMDKIERAYEIKTEVLGKEIALELARMIILRTLDQDWQQHLLGIDEMREGIGLRAYAQLDPLIEYKREATLMFEDLMYNVHKEIFSHFFRAQIVAQEPRHRRRDMRYKKDDIAGLKAEERAARQRDHIQGDEEPEEVEKPQPVRVGPKTGRNDPCPCGSGKKYKKCCGSRI